MIRPQPESQQMRNHESNKTNHTGKSHRCADGQRYADEDESFLFFNRKAQEMGFLLP